MKLPLASLLALLLTTIVILADTTTTELFTEAQRAYLAGKNEVAKAKFDQILQADPNHAGAKNYLKLMASTAGKGKSKMASDLEKMIVPKIGFKDASFGAVLEYLKNKASEISDKTITPSFVLQLPPNFAEQTPVTLELENVPFTEVLRYLGEITAVKFDIQQYAIVVTPR